MRPMKTNIGQMVVCRKRRHHRTEIKHPIGNMKYENRVRTSEMLQIDFNRFLGEQMEGDGVATKSIHKQNVEFLRTGFIEFTFERKTRITRHNLDFCGRVADVREIGIRSCGIAYDLGIQFIESKRIARTTVGCQGTHSHADDSVADGTWRNARSLCFHEESDAAMARIIRGR